MKVYIKFLTITFYNSFLYVIAVMFSLVFILNLLSEIDFFKNINTSISQIIFLASLNSPSMIFEMFPFIFLITAQVFFIKFFNNNELEIFKYSGLKNSKILLIIGIVSIITGVLITTLFYNLSSNFKNIYLEIKSKYTVDGKYLAVITKNGLWIKDRIGKKSYIINSSEIENNFLTNTFITEFDEDYNVTRNIKSNKIDISNNEWLIYDLKLYENNEAKNLNLLKLNTNFDYHKIQSLYSSLSSFDLFQLFQLRENYKKLKYSLIEIDLQLIKLLTFPIYLFLMALFSSLIMLRTKRMGSTTVKISLGLFFSVIIYYVNNFFYVMGSTERISVLTAVFIPIFILTVVNTLMMKNIDEK